MVNSHFLLPLNQLQNYNYKKTQLSVLWTGSIMTFFSATTANVAWRATNRLIALEEYFHLELHLVLENMQIKFTAMCLSFRLI